eukprot:jgi/Hompol1/2246/HPOL_005903-RA
MAPPASVTASASASGPGTGTGQTVLSKARSKTQLTGSTPKLAKSSSKSLGSIALLAEPNASASKQPNEAPAAVEQTKNTEETELSEQIDEYYSQLERLPLPAEMLKRGLSQMGPSPDGLRQVYQKLSIPFAGLNNISALREYPYIQTLELQGNNITALGSMRYLVHLDLSNNNLVDVLAFDPPPYNLQHVDLSRNRIVTIRDLSMHRFLSVLNLECNQIVDITGLSGCVNLRHLCVAFNRIENINGLRGLSLQTLDLVSDAILV